MRIDDQTRAVLKRERPGSYSRAKRWRVAIDACEERYPAHRPERERRRLRRPLARSSRSLGAG